MMKRITAALIVSLSLSAFPDSVPADYTDGERSTVLITPEMMAVAQQMFGTNATPLLHAIRLQMTKYDNDMQKEAGRVSWHGRRIREEFYTNDLVKVSVYTNEVDGSVWRFKTRFKPRPVPDRKYPPPPMTNGIPVALARARMKSYENHITVSNVTETIDVGK